MRQYLSNVALEVTMKLNFVENIVRLRDKSEFSRLIDDFEFKCGRRLKG